MKKHTKRLLATILSAGVIASSIGSLIPASAAAANVQMIQHETGTRQLTFGNVTNRFYNIRTAKAGTVKNPRYFNQYESTYYNNTVKAVNFFSNLGFNYRNKVFYSNNTTATTTTVYISYYGLDTTSTGPNPLAGDVVSELGLITAGSVNQSVMYDFVYAPDVIAHEYVHLMTQQLKDWNRVVRTSSTEAGAIVEAYSDILGELTETNPDWRMGGNLFVNTNQTNCLRDLKNPRSSKVYNYGSRNYYVNYSDFKRANFTQFDNNHAYEGSTVLSHAAYLMYTAGINKDLLARFWYDSISLFSGDMTMPNVRKAVIVAVNKYCDDTNASARGRSALLERVTYGFNQVGLY